MDLEQLSADIPNYQRFLTVDELNSSTYQLAQAFPELVRTKVIGNTQHGDPIELITIGDGSLQAFVFGAPDPDEPIGCMMIEYLTQKLCSDENFRQELGYTWHFIKAIEADSMRKNEGWFNGPFTVKNYAKYLYRGWVSDKADFAFPIEYKRFKFDQVLPETKILMSVIDEVKPQFMYALHNSKFGGVWYDVSRKCTLLYKIFETIPEWFGMTLNLGETEGGNNNQVAPAIYCNQKTFSQRYDEMEESGNDPAKMQSWGISSREYARRYNTFSLVAEVPFWNDPRANDLTLTDTLYQEVLLNKLASMDTFIHWVETVLQPVQNDLRLKSPIRRFVEKVIQSSKNRQSAQYEWAQTSKEVVRPATHAEVFSNKVLILFIQTALCGMIARIMNDEVENGNPNQAIVQVCDAAQTKLIETSNLLETNSNYTTVPIRNLVGVQLCAGLATAKYLQT